MKWTGMLIAGLFLMAVSCNGKDGAGTAVVHMETKNENFSQFIEQNYVPSGRTDGFEPVTDGKGFPAELINELGKALVEGDADAAIAGLHDDSLRLSEDERFDIDVAYGSVNVFNRHKAYPYYKCDVNGDGIEELLGVEEEYPGSVYLYTDTEEGYDLYGTYFIGDVRCYALFLYDNQFYLAVSCNDENTPGESDVRLYLMDYDNFHEDQYHKHICIRKKKEVSNRKLLYKNTEFSAIDELQAYVDEIIFDLSSVGQSYHVYMGDETRREDVQELWEESGREFGAVYSIDVDNDGTEDYFDRFQIWFRSENGNDELTTEFEWFTKDMVEITCPFTEWRDRAYIRKKAWFQIFDGKTVVFSLYRKNSAEDYYVIDARIHEDGKTTILYDSLFEIRTSGIHLALSEQMPYSSPTVYLPMECKYENRDVKKAFPDNLDQLAEELLARSHGRFILDNQGSVSIPPVLKERIKEIGYLGGLKFDEEPQLYSGKFSKYEFADLYSDSLNDALYYDDEYVYEYQSGQNKYYLVATGERLYTDLNLDIYEDEGGKLALYDQLSGIDMFTALIYQEELYLLESHFGGESSLYIHRLLPEKVRGFATADISIAGYKWENIYGCGDPYENDVSKYVESIDDTLPDVSAGAYTGDESYDFDRVKQQRLKSVSEKLISEEPDFMEIDFNNDGVPEYFSKMCEGNRELYSDVYQFKDGKAAMMDYTMNNYRISDKKDLKYHLKQLWFKEISGKIFTFRLFSRDDYYVLNASLVRGADISQVVSYVIVPIREIRTTVGGNYEK